MMVQQGSSSRVAPPSAISDSARPAQAFRPLQGRYSRMCRA